MGFNQAQAVEPIIARLPIYSVCCSPLKRAKETKDIICTNIQAAHYELPELGECTLQIWNDMTLSGVNAFNCSHAHVKEFMQRTLVGINHSLSYEGPVLIVAHGGIHWALCCLMEIADHEWIIDNCLPVHFYTDNSGQWKARKLTTVESTKDIKD